VVGNGKGVLENGKMGIWENSLEKRKESLRKYKMENGERKYLYNL